MEEIKIDECIEDWYKILDVFMRRVSAHDYSSSRFAEDLSSLISIILLYTSNYTQQARDSMKETLPALIYIEDVSINNQLEQLKTQLQHLLEEQANDK